MLKNHLQIAVRNLLKYNRIVMGPRFLIFASLAALAIAILTVSYQALRAVLANLVEALRYE